MHLSKQDFVNSLTILCLYVYVHKLNWTELVELSCKGQWQTMYIMPYYYQHTWAIMALVDPIVVRFIWLDGYNIFILALELFYF